MSIRGKEFFRTCNVLPFSCTHLALWRGKGQGKRPKVHAKQKGFKNFFIGDTFQSSLYRIVFGVFFAINWTDILLDTPLKSEFYA